MFVCFVVTLGLIRRLPDLYYIDIHSVHVCPVSELIGSVKCLLIVNIFDCILPVRIHLSVSNNMLFTESFPD